MQLYNIGDWKALHFPDRTILRSDVKYMSLWEYGQLEGLDVEPMDRPGHYRVTGFHTPTTEAWSAAAQLAKNG